MTFKKLLKEMATEFKIPADKVEALTTAMTTIVDGRVEEATKPLNEKIQEFEKTQGELELNSAFAEFGEVSERDKKILMKLTEKGDGEDFKTALKRTATEFGITPTTTKAEPKPSDAPKAPDAPTVQPVNKVVPKVVQGPTQVAPEGVKAPVPYIPGSLGIFDQG